MASCQWFCVLNLLNLLHIGTIYCDVDPEAYMNTTQLISYNGYPVEEYDVYTSDGFILKTQRIPHGKNSTLNASARPVVLLQHGLNAGSDCYVMEGNGSLGFMLADAGMDVWLSNSRGNSYALRNTHYNRTQDEFWAWSFDEMAERDLPAVVDHILGTTNTSQIYYIGHSQGTNIAFGAFSQNQTLADRIKLFIAMSPIARLQHIKGILKLIADIAGDNWAEIYKVFGKKYFMENSTIGMEVATKFCNIEPKICAEVSSLITGFDMKESNLSRAVRYTAHASEGTSVQNMVHYGQEVNSGLYQKYDYGSPEKNMKKYNQSTPPEYDLTRVAVPTALFYGGSDWLADPKDVDFVRSKLPNIIHESYFDSWDHDDFIIAIDAPFQLYPEIISLIKSREKLKIKK